MHGPSNQAPAARHAQLVEQLRRFDSERRYYALTLLATEQGGVGWSAQSHFAGMSPNRFGWEMREASLVDPNHMTDLWAGLEQGWLVVEDELSLRIWFRLGGHALVNPELARKHLMTMVEPHECAPDGPIGFVRAASLRSADSSRRGSRRARRHVFERDGHRCQRCKRGEPEVELTRHHLFPHRFGGLSRAKDLITLCGECHESIEADTGSVIEFAYERVLPCALEDSHEHRVRLYRREIARLIKSGD